MHKNILSLVLSLVLSLAATAALAAERSPLPLEGKKSLYQRVVTHPGAKLLSAPEAEAKAVQDKVKTFSVLYVYDKKNGFLEVGPSSNAATGWLAEEAATFWPQAMTLLFTERTGRMPVLFFKDQKGLETISASETLQTDLESLQKKVAEAKKSGGLTEELPVVASEPPDEEGAVARSRFYLMPIKHMSEPFEGTKFLEVASIDPGSAGPGDGKGSGKDGAAGDGADGKNLTMRTGIAFVIDTTISMKPYIDQSLNVVRSAFDNIEKQGLGDNVAFAVVAFRGNMSQNPKVEYVTQKVSDFTPLSKRKELEEALSRVTEATVSTPSFNEDSMAGVKAAVDELSWDDYHSRIIVLISDAGPLKPGDPLASTKMGPAEMLDYAKAKNIWLTTCHVRSPAGSRDHAYAEKAYRELTRTSDGASSYMPINAPTPQAGAKNFAAVASQLAESLSKVVKVTASRKAPQPPKEAKPASPDSPEDEARRIAETIGYAMQLDFLGRQKENRAPGVVDAWIADMDLARLADGQYSPTVEVAVLLTKNQLSDLQRVLQIIVDNAERTKKTDSRDFFQSVLSASAQMARDPAAFSSKPGQNLQESGVLGEFLEGLPYKSDVMLLREEDWYRMSVGEQTAFVNRLKSRIARYEEYDKDRSNWESFGAQNAGDWMYRVPLSVLP